MNTFSAVSLLRDMRDRRKFQRTSKILVGKIMKIKIDKETDTLYFRLDNF